MSSSIAAEASLAVAYVATKYGFDCIWVIVCGLVFLSPPIDAATVGAEGYTFGAREDGHSIFCWRQGKARFLIVILDARIAFYAQPPVIPEPVFECDRALFVPDAARGNTRTSGWDGIERPHFYSMSQARDSIRVLWRDRIFRGNTLGDDRCRRTLPG